MGHGVVVNVAAVGPLQENMHAYHHPYGGTLGLCFYEVYYIICFTMAALCLSLSVSLGGDRTLVEVVRV